MAEDDIPAWQKRLLSKSNDATTPKSALQAQEAYAARKGNIRSSGSSTSSGAMSPRSGRNLAGSSNSPASGSVSPSGANFVVSPTSRERGGSSPATVQLKTSSSPAVDRSNSTQNQQKTSSPAVDRSNSTQNQQNMSPLDQLNAMSLNLSTPLVTVSGLPSRSPRPDVNTSSPGSLSASPVARRTGPTRSNWGRASADTSEAASPPSGGIRSSSDNVDAQSPTSNAANNSTNNDPTDPYDVDDRPAWQKRLRPAGSSRISTSPSPRSDPDEKPEFVELRQKMKQSHDSTLSPNSNNLANSNSNRISPVNTATSSRDVSPQHHPQASDASIPPDPHALPQWQLRLLQKQEEEAKTGTSLSSSLSAMQSYYKRKGKILEPIQPGIPGWKQRIMQSRRRRGSTASSAVSLGSFGKKEEGEGEEWQKRLMAGKADRQQQSNIAATTSSTLHQNHEWTKRITDFKQTRERKRRESIVRQQEPIVNVLQEIVEEVTLEMSIPQPEEIVTETLTLTLSLPVMQEEVVIREEKKEEKVVAKKQTEAELQKTMAEEEKMVKGGPKKKAFKKMLWHEQYKAANTLKQLMSGSFTTSALLDHGEEVVTVAGMPKENKALLAYLSKPEVVGELLGHVLFEPIPREKVPEARIPELRKQLKHSDTCLQLFLQTTALLNILVDYQNGMHLRTALLPCLKKTRNFIVFGRLVQMLVLLFMLRGKDLITLMLEEHKDLLSVMVEKVGIVLAEDVVLFLRLVLQTGKKVPSAVQWVLDSQVTLHLISRMAPEESVLVKENVSMILGEILTEMKAVPDDDDDLNPVKSVASTTHDCYQPIIDQFKSEETYDMLFGHFTESSTSLLHGITLLQTVLDLSIESEDSMLLLKFIDNIDTFLSILAPNNASGPVPTVGRRTVIAVLNFILALISEEPEVGTILVESGFYALILDLIFDHPTNNVIHDICLQLFLFLCSMADVEQVEEVFEQCGLLDRLGEVWEKMVGGKGWSTGGRLPFSVSSGAVGNGSARGGARTNAVKEEISYFGHLAILSNMIADLCEDSPNSGLGRMAASSTLWRNAVLPNLENYNACLIASQTFKSG